MKRSLGDKGITLIALVVTIVVLLILAGVSLGAALGENGIIGKAKRVKQIQEEAARQEAIELEFWNKNDNKYESGYAEVFNSTKKVNNPKLSKGMIPVKWNGSNWVVVDQNDSTWFDYDTKKWANVMLSDGTYKQGEVQVGQVVQENELGSMFVWIPRYAYKMNYVEDTTNKNAGGSIDITFLRGNTNKDKDGNVYQKDSSSVDTSVTPIVHPGFTIGGRELTGLWVAKFEASATNKDGKVVGNRNKKQDGSFESALSADNQTVLKSLPSKISWRHITIGEAEYQSMLIAGVNREKYGVENANSHLIKNSELGAVAYMCYSQYGSVPKTNGCGNNYSSVGYYDLYTGMGANTTTSEGRYESTAVNLEAHKYTTNLGKLASTTGDVTGIYDMAGGSWEFVAAYLDNGNGNLNNYGKNSGGTIKFFENSKINDTYVKYFDKYEMSDEFKQATVTVQVPKDGGGTESQTVNVSELYQSNENTVTMAHHIGRQLLTQSVWDRLPHGIGMTEVSNTFSFYGAYKTTSNTYSWTWFKTAGQANAGTSSYATSWDSDHTSMVGSNASYPFVVRGGNCSYGGGAGVFSSNIAGGAAVDSYGFRPVVVV